MIMVGTSGWHYEHWRGPFYPPDLPAKRFLSFYQEHFHTVEINSSFYRLPSEAALWAWRQTVGPGFIFAVKASRVITHLKKLKDVGAALTTFLDRISLLGQSLGPILLQLPPRFRFQAERLETFLAALPSTYRFALELRDPSWLVPEAFDLLRRYQAALCLYDLAGRQSPLEVTSDFVYVRLHGPGGAYQGNYSTASLLAWTEYFQTWEAKGLDVYCYFDNDEAGYAAHNALTVLDLLAGARQPSGPPAAKQ